MSKRKRGKHKRLFPARYAATAVSTSRIDGIKAYAYNLQRSKTTTGPSSDAEPILNNNFMQEVPRTISLTTHEPGLRDGITGEKYSKHNLPKKTSSFFRYKTPRKLAVEAKHELMVAEEQLKSGTLLTFFKVWQSEMRMQGIPEYHCQTLVKKGEFSIKLYFCGNEALFVQENAVRRFISKTYVGLKVAMQHYKEDRISWIAKELL